MSKLFQLPYDQLTSVQRVIANIIFQEMGRVIRDVYLERSANTFNFIVRIYGKLQQHHHVMAFDCDEVERMSDDEIIIMIVNRYRQETEDFEDMILRIAEENKHDTETESETETAGTSPALRKH
jgi:hypothetical protein